MSNSKQLQADGEVLNQLIQHLPMALFAKDYSQTPGVFVSWNDFAEKLWGLSKSQVLGHSDFDFFPREQAEFFQKMDLKTIEEGKTVHIDEEIVSSPIGDKVVKTWKIPVVDQELGGRFLMGVSLDITEKKQLEENLDLERAKSIQASKLSSLGEMAAGIAHEINNPLAIIDAQMDELRYQFQAGKLDPQIFISSSESIFNNIQRISKIIVGLRKFARDDQHQEKTPHDIIKIIEDALSLCRGQITAHGIELNIDCDPNSGHVLASDVQIAQIIVNLLNNARDAVKNASSKKIVLQARGIGSDLEIRVSDSGDGVSPEVEEKLFDPFFTTKPVGEGTGLGLSICQAIAQDHGGEIYLDRELTQTTFVVRLPRLNSR